MLTLATDVVEHIRSVFAECNARASEKVSRNPNAPEESLDLTWIETVGRFSTPVVLPSGSLVKIETHYLGGMRHFRRWEIADIGVLVDFRTEREPRRSKVALLQSKRLYPLGTPVREEAQSDYEIGFARLADPEDDSLSLGFSTEFRFERESGYQQIRAGSEQVTAIDQYEREVSLKVYYHLYNPWHVPLVQRVPLAGYVAPEGQPDLGVRVVPSHLVRAAIAKKEGQQWLRLSDLGVSQQPPPFGWRLEQFICDELLACREGDEFQSIRDERIQTLFNRRSGAIAAAIAITIEAPRTAA